MQNIFSKYLERGICLVPLKSGIPQVKTTPFQYVLPSQKDAEKWGNSGYEECAIICGKVSNVVALDFDTDDLAIINKVEAIAGISPVKKFGTKGFTTFYKYNGEKTARFGNCIDFLSDKHLCTIPPSKHRSADGVKYEWIGNHSLLDIELPVLPDNFCAIMNLLFPRPERPHSRIEKYTPSDFHKKELSDAEEMLSYITPNVSRDIWIEIGMALKDEFGDMACELWHRWSQPGKTYKQRDAQSVWRSFSGQGVTIGTLIFYAKEAGYDPVVRPSFDVDISYLEKPLKKADLLPSTTHIQATGLVGEIADWMTATAWKPQPLLSLSAALVLVGFLKGRKYITETDVYPNIYAFNIAGSACGKERPQAGIKHIMVAAKLENSLINKAASAPGFIDALMACAGHGITVIDEMADYISSATNKNMSGHKKLVLTNWIEAFTSCNTYIDGERRADAAKEKTKRVYNPLFCLLGSTNAISLKSSLSGGDVSNGLLNRFLFFQSQESPRKRKFKDFDLKRQLPDETIEKIKSYLENTNDIYGNQAGLTKVPFNDDAMELFDKIDDFYEDQCQALDVNDRLRFLYGRAHEYVAKVALILCDDIEITLANVELAHVIVSLSVNTAITFCGDLTDTREEQDFFAVREFIKQRGKVLMGEITTSVRSVKAARIKEIVESLADAGIVTVERITTKGRPSFQVTFC